MLLRQRWPKAMEKGLSSQMEEWIDASFTDRYRPDCFDGEGDFMMPMIASRAMLIGVGAPIAHFLPEVARAMRCEAWMDPMSPVANALGAITAGVMAQVVLRIKPDQEMGGPGGFHVYGAEEKPWFNEYEEALAWACGESEKLAAEQARSQGAGVIHASHQVREKVGYITPAEDDPQRLAMFNGGVAPELMQPQNDGILLETVITARALGEMDWETLDTINN
jgi:hypothetical protein